MSEWRLIDSAPKDVPVLVNHKEFGVIEATQSSAMAEAENHDYRLWPWDSPAQPAQWLLTSDLTHWMPKPDPPVAPEGEKP